VRRVIGVLHRLATPAMLQRHWEEIMVGIGREAKDALALTVRQLMDVRLYDCTPT
jgi:hypothetical protein